MKVRHVFGLAWVVAGLAGLEARGDQLSGTVRSVDLDGKKVIVAEKVTDKNIDVTVTAQTSIATAAGLPLSLKNLKRGDGVGLTHTGGVAAAIVVNQAALIGRVDTINLDEKTMVVTEKGTDRDIEVALKPKTTIETTDGKALALKDLKSGDGLSVTYAGADALKVLVNVKPPELTAHVKSVAADLRSLVVTDIETRADVKVAVTSETVIVTSQGKTMELKDLKKGDGVGIAHDASVASKIVVNAAAAR
jgi:hypothetical protein